MGTFKCQGCGNLHGAPVEACGMCGSPTVVAVDEQGNLFSGPAPFASASADAKGTPPGPSEFEQVISRFGPIVETYLQNRDGEAQRRAERHAALDEASDERGQRKSLAQLELLEALTRLAHAATSKIIADTRAAQNAPGQ